MLRIAVVSLMPDMFNALNFGVTGRAFEQRLVQLDRWNPRDWSNNKHRQVDDQPYGGGPGMVMMYEPLHAALCYARQQMPGTSRTIYVSPQGKTVRQDMINEVVHNMQPVIFLAGRYEGIDERLLQNDIDEEWSAGDFVLSGGEIAAIAFIDAIVRLLPGSLGHPASAQQDSFMHGLLDHPHYTRPAHLPDASVPEVLLNGNHRDIERWRKKHALGNTWLKRPDLLDKYTFSAADKALLDEFKHEHGESHNIASPILGATYDEHY